MNIGPWQLIIIALVILVLFGRGRISEMMGDFGKGIKSFKKGMTEEDTDDASPPPQLSQTAKSGNSKPASDASSKASPTPVEAGSDKSGA